MVQSSRILKNGYAIIVTSVDIYILFYRNKSEKDPTIHLKGRGFMKHPIYLTINLTYLKWNGELKTSSDK